MDVIQEKIQNLQKFTESDDLEYMEEELYDLLKSSPEKERYIPDILGLMERNPLTDWGLPGALVHFMESCNPVIYENLLKESIKRCPALHTLFMLNRLCNGKTVEEIPEYIDIIYNIYKNTSVPEIIRDTAGDYLNFQL